MKSILVASTLCALASLFVFGCSSGETSPTGQSSEDISASSGGASTVKPPVCGPHEQTCEFANDKDICVSRCVPDGVMCVKPNCVVCDPNGPQPHAGCTWSTTQCEWECPVCDPPPPPEKTGCTWDEKACVWLCL
jgi:hypothetical protein